jgi:cytochrome bd-type quinol oxidase subunit 1
MPANMWYYLFLPIRCVGQFPWLAVSPAPMPVWGYYEAMIGALFTATPLMLLALLLPLLRKLEMHGMRLWLTCCLVLAAALIVFDSYVGGLGWRYSADFGWLVALASIPGFLWLLNGREPGRSLAGANDAVSGDGIVHVTPWRWLMRWTVVLLVIGTLAVAIVSCFALSRDDSMIDNNSALWHQVQAWFTLV